jgi:hypothetical protein
VLACCMGETPLLDIAMEWHPGQRKRTSHRAARLYVMSRMMSCMPMGVHPRGGGHAQTAATPRTGPQFLDQTSPWAPPLASILHWCVIGSSWCGGGVAWAVVRGCVAADGVCDPLVVGRPMASARTHDAPHISVMTVNNHPHRRWSSYIDAQHYRLRGSKLL